MLYKSYTGDITIAIVALFLLIPYMHYGQNENPISSNDTTNLSIADSLLVNAKLIHSDTILSESDSLINYSYLITSDTSLIISDTITSPRDSLRVIYFEGSVENLKLNKYTYIDTNTYNFQKYDPLYKNNGLFSTLSNIGQASKNLVYTPTLSTVYYLGSAAFRNYLYHNESVKYYKLFVPYTDLTYVMGSKREQNFNVVFTRELVRGLTFGADYALNFSPESNSPYLRSGINEQRLFLTAQYYTKNKRYGVIANYLRNKIAVEENGGIVDDSIFENNIESDRRIIPVNLMYADNQIKQSGFFVEQYFNFLAPTSKKETNKRKIDPGNISYSFRYRRNKFVYQDEDTLASFYIGHSAPLDSISTFDSLYQDQIQNTIRWSNIGYHENPNDKVFYMFLGATHSIINQRLPYDSVSTHLTQIVAFGGVAFNFGKSFHLDADANYVTGNYNQGDYQLNAFLNQYLGNEVRNIGFLKFGLNITHRTPEWYFNNYQSNYYRWSNNLKKENYLILSGSYNYKEFSAGAKFYTINNYTYLDDSVRPTQIETAETLLQIFAEGTIPLNKFGINTRIVYQTTSQPDIIRFPSLTGVIDIYYRTPIFKKAGTVQTGFQITYFSEYYADAYMPELRLFHLQNTKKIGNYPYADFYITLMVKRARLFFKLAHFNSYLGNYRYYLAPGYPARDARFNFGVSWRFHD